MKARENPFRVERQHALAFRFEQGGLPELMTRLESLAFRAAIVGPHGAGKTTLWLELMEQVRRRGMSVASLRLTEADKQQACHLSERWIQQSPQDAVLFLDGAEQLHARCWKALERQSKSRRGLVVTTHAPGTLPTLYEAKTSVGLLQELVQELMQGGAGGCVDDLKALYGRHHGNLRECFRELYDRQASGR